MSTVFEWHQRGRGVELHAYPGALLRLEVHVDRGRYSVEVPERALHELREALVETIGDQQRAELLEGMHASDLAANTAENERDEALERVKALEAQLREQLAYVEQLKSALDLADQQTRATP